FLQGSFGAHYTTHWPLAFERWTIGTTVHPDPAKRCVFDRDEPDPIEAVIAAEAWTHRYCTMITMLRTGEVQARGVSAIIGPSELIPRSIWSHEDFEFDPFTANILQQNPQPTGSHDDYVKRWIGVALEKPAPASQCFTGNRLATIRHHRLRPSPLRGRPEKG